MIKRASRWSHLIVVATAFAASGTRAQAPPAEPADYYYFNPDGRGAHAFYNPQNFIVQGGLGAMYGDRVDQFPWGAGFRSASSSLARPVRAIDEYGWGRFFYREFVPHIGAGQNYVPNWAWHLVGGGMRTKLMEEYYRHHGLEHARLWAWLTMYTYHFLNETVQAAKFGDKDRATIDPIADMYFFDWLGGLLFRWDPVNAFMSGTLHMREWSYQAQLNPLTMRLFNNGQLYWLRLAIAGTVSLSFLTGEQVTSLNLTYGWGDGHQVSAGAGPQAKGFVARNNGDTDASDVILVFGAYYSVDDNPVATLTFEPEARNASAALREAYRFTGKCILNLYPGPLRILGEPIGVTLAYHRDAVFAGFSVGPLPAALAVSTPAF